MRKIYDAKVLGDAHRAILKRITPGSRVLDVGCATGYVSARLAGDLGCQVVGMELCEEAATSARERCDEVIVGDITEERTWKRIRGRFDHIVFADVLEHAADPPQVLRFAAHLLAEGGSVVASVPNVAFRKVRLGLLLGRFDYTESGPLDRTHLRFFTGKSAAQLFETAGYAVTAVIPTFKSSRDAVLGRLSTGLFAYHYVIEAHPSCNTL